MRSDVPEMGVNGARVLIQVATLDDASPEELLSGPVLFLTGVTTIGTRPQRRAIL